MNCPVLYAEDDADDVFLMRRAFAAVAVQHPLEIVSDGRQAIDCLSAQNAFAARRADPLPCVVLLDLKLPEVPGLEVLRWIRQQPALRALPVVILSISQEPSDVVAAYELGANSFLVKPRGSERLNALVRSLDEYWLRHNRTGHLIRPPGSG
ncbi:MAG: response regulator [Verrucomicrobiota bacterium]